MKLLKYFELFPLLDSLESVRPGIRDRVWNHLIDCGRVDEVDFPFNGRVLSINLHYFGNSDDGLTLEEIEIRKDLTLIYNRHRIYFIDKESFNVMPIW